MFVKQEQESHHLQPNTKGFTAGVTLGLFFCCCFSLLLILCGFYITYSNPTYLPVHEKLTSALAMSPQNRTKLKKITKIQTKERNITKMKTKKQEQQ